MTGLLLLAVEEEDIGTGPIGLLIVLQMLVGTFFHLRNMSGRLKRLPREFPDERTPEQRAKDELEKGDEEG